MIKCNGKHCMMLFKCQSSKNHREFIIIPCMWGAWRKHLFFDLIRHRCGGFEVSWQRSGKNQHSGIYSSEYKTSHPCSTPLDLLKKINALSIKTGYTLRAWRDYSFGTCLKTCVIPVLVTYIIFFTCFQ